MRGGAAENRELLKNIHPRLIPSRVFRGTRNTARETRALPDSASISGPMLWNC